MKQEISNRVDELIKAWNEKVIGFSKRYSPNLSPDTLGRQDGKKYIKLVVSNNSAFGFVDSNTGDIFMAASWKAPAKGIRGSVMADDYGMSCVGPYGVNYIKYGNTGWA